jgi:hypothetical protein
MTVAELIAYLQTQPQGLRVIYCIFSEYCLLDFSDIEPVEACVARPDGWVHVARPDQPTETYLRFPGN